MKDKKEPDEEQKSVQKTDEQARVDCEQAIEIGGYQGPEPTRYGDWEQKGRCTDF